MNRTAYNTIKQVLSNIKKYKMFDYNDTVVVGVSGGADSVTLLHILYTISKEYHYNLNLKVAHINHNIRKDTARRDELFVKNLCEQMSVPYFCRSINVPQYAKENKLSEEEAGRQIRYSFFRELAGDNGKIATAHNLNDNAETVLMRFIRGTGIKGLTGIDIKRNNIIRPLLNVSRNAIEQYIKDCGLVHITDETNLVPIYTRNKIRLNLIPEIQREYNPNFIETVNANIETYISDNDFIEEFTNKQYKECVDTFENELHINIEVLCVQHPSIQKRLIIKALEDFSKMQDCDMKIKSVGVSSIIELVNKSVNTSVDISQSIVAERTYDEIVFLLKQSSDDTENKDTENAIKVADFIGETVSVNNQKIHICIKEQSEIINNSCEANIPLCYINKLCIRTKQRGDVFTVNECIHKQLGKHMSNLKIPYALRTQIAVLCADNECFWVVGYSASRFQTRSGKFINFKYIKE